MYEKHFNFTEKPFSIVPNPGFLFLTDKHRNALTHLEYGLMEGVGFVLLTGEVGAGKTTLIRHLLNQIEEDLLAAVIFNTNVTADQLITLIVQEFELAPRTSKAENLDLLYEFFIKQFAAGKRVLLIIDEAQNLPYDALEEVRMLSNLHSDDQLFLQIMLVGQPALKATLKKPALSQLAQRIAVNYHLAPLSRQESEHYIASRLQKAGGREDLFSREAIHLIHDAAAGIPRSINLLCDAALVYGFADGLLSIDASIIEQVLHDKGGMGLEVAMEEKTLPPATSSATPPDEVMEKIHSLEENVRALRMQMDLQVEELRGRADGFRDDMIARLTNLLQEERKKHDTLLAEHVRLQAKYAEPNKATPEIIASPPNPAGENAEKKDGKTSREPAETEETPPSPREKNVDEIEIPEQGSAQKRGWFASLWS